MTSVPEMVDIRSRDFWFKVVEFLQQNWAVFDEVGGRVLVWFFDDGACVFDQLSFASIEDAEEALRRNGFERYADDPGAMENVRRPEPPFSRRDHPNGPIYSSGRYWR